MAQENRIYRVRIEAYDPDTDETEVILTETEDEGYSKIVFLGEDLDGALRSIAMAVNAFEAAGMIATEPLLKNASKLVFISEMVSGEGGSSCPQ